MTLALEQLEMELVVAKGALARVLTPIPSPLVELAAPKPRVRIPELVVFGGARSSKEQENFI